MSGASAPSPKVAFLGTGTMGAPMARNIARAGLPVVAWNRTAEKVEALAGDGVAAAATAAEAATGADVLVTMLADGPAIESALTGDSGALDGLADGAVWIQMSTVGALAAERLAAMSAAHGVAFVDAPVLGSAQPAEDGELVILASGPAERQQRCACVFDAVGRRTLWLGEAGAGSRLKIVVNAWLMVGTAAIAETLALAETLDVDPAWFFDVTDGGAIGALYTELNGAAMVQREFPVNFPLAHATKDAGLALEAAGKDAALFQVLAATHAQFSRAEQLGHAQSDWAAVIHAALRA